MPPHAFCGPAVDPAATALEHGSSRNVESNEADVDTSISPGPR
jgi:hypothetical protein